MKVLLLGWLPLLITGSLSAQARPAEVSGRPFGLEMGMTKAQLSRISSLTPMEGSPIIFRMTTVSTPHPRFESYLVIVSESVGLCKIVGLGTTVESSSLGTELHSEFETLEEALASRYGAHKTVDDLQSGSIWTERNYWMMSLYQKERFLDAFWDHEEGSSLPSNLQAISLSGKALSTSQGYVAISYEFTNFDSCKRELDQKRDSGL